MQDTVEELALGYLCGCNDTIASNYTRIVCIALEALEAVWAFSIALDCSNTSIDILSRRLLLVLSERHKSISFTC